MFIYGMKNITNQAVLTNGLINFGNVYRRYSKSKCGSNMFANNGTSVTLDYTGIYHITINIVITGTEAGTATVQLYSNGVPIDGAVASETITTAATEARTLTIDYYVLVDTTKVLNIPTNKIQSLSLVNTGIGINVTSVVFNVDKVL